MKRFLTILVPAVLLAGVIVAGTWRTGEGTKQTATTTHTRYVWSNELFNTVSVLNNDLTNDVFCLINTTTNNLITNITQNTAVAIPPKTCYTFDGQRNGVEIENICYATTNGTADLYISGY